MCNSGTDYGAVLSDVLMEILSAIASLCMEPKPITEDIGTGRMLSETDFWAKHAVEHLKAARELLTTAVFKDVEKDNSTTLNIWFLSAENGNEEFGIPFITTNPSPDAIAVLEQWWHQENNQPDWEYDEETDGGSLFGPFAYPGIRNDCAEEYQIIKFQEE